MPARRKIALISGGSRGLGAELVTGFLDRRYGVATLSRSKTAFIADMQRGSRRRRFLWSCVDGRDPEALQAFVREVGERLGRIDVLVNNAGVAADGILATMRTREIIEVIEANLTAALVLARACSRFMLRQGSGCIVNISSVHAIRGHSVQQALAASSARAAAKDPALAELVRKEQDLTKQVNAALGTLNNVLAIPSAERDEKGVQQIQASIATLRGERDKAGRPLVVLAAATRVLPDDTYLTEMELQKRKVTLSGRSAAAARLIGPLAADGAFRNPGFAAPVTRLEALHTELFTINAEVAP